MKDPSRGWKLEDGEPGLISNARMYSVTRPATMAWSDIFGWVQRKAGVVFESVPHDPPLLLSDLWSREDLGMVMMCGLPIARRRPPVHLLAAAVPDLPLYQGQARYTSYLAVAQSSKAETLVDTFGTRVGYTLRDSHSGYHALRHHLITRHGGDDRYRQVIGGLMNPRGVIAALIKGDIDIGPLDSYAFDLMKAAHDVDAMKVRIVGMTGFAPMPAIVCSQALDLDVVNRLREALIEAGRVPELASQRTTLLLREFVPMEPAAYEVQEEIASLVEHSTATW